MRIAIFVDRFPTLSETFILNQVTGLLDRGHHIDIYAKPPREGPVHPDVASYRLDSRTHYWPAVPPSGVARWFKGMALLAGELARHPRAIQLANVAAYGREALTLNLAYSAWAVLKRERFDVVHCHFGNMGIRGMALRDAGLLEGRLVTSFHGFDLSSYVRGDGRRLYPRLFRSGDLFLPVSEEFRRRLLRLGCPPQKILVHRMGIDARRFPFRARATSSDGLIRLISVARLVEKKGIEYAIRAVAALGASGRRVSYTIIGDGPLMASLEHLVKQLRLSGVVHFSGARPQPEVIRMLGEAHLLVAPSVVASNGDEEGVPAVIMEAMATGLPVIATRHSGIPELVEEGVSGVLVPERNAHALAQAIAETADNPNRWPAMGQAGRDRVLEQYEISKLNDSLVMLFEELAGRSAE